MVKQKSIDPKTITKPIQLLACWLLGLVLVNGSFLSTATIIENPIWAVGTLVVASVVNVPLFLVSLFLLQTKFRPEMQEDSFYHEYLVNKLGQPKDSTDKQQIESVPVENSVETKGLWSGYRVLMNDSLEGADETRSKLREYNIPVTGSFGMKGAPLPPDKVVTIGRGFEIDHLKILIKALSETEINWVNYGADEEELNEYDNIILVGSFLFNPKDNSIPINEANSLLSNETVTVKQFYQKLFEAQMEE